MTTEARRHREGIEVKMAVSKSQVSGPNVVFVFGAGMSKPYGFPTGDSYRRMLISLAECRDADELALFEGPDADDRNAAVRASHRHLCKSVGVRRRWNEFARRFRHEGHASIDKHINEALARGGGEDVELARALIVMVIAGSEPDRPMDDGAYKQLLDILHVQRWVDDDQPVAALGRVGLLTFNYDRGLERAIYERLGDTTLWGPFHAYGSIGRLVPDGGDGQPRMRNLPWAAWRKHGSADGKFVRFQRPMISYVQVEHASRDIDVTRSDAAGTDPRTSQEHHVCKCHERAKRSIDACSMLVFLGFGFDPANCRLLGLPQLGVKGNKDEGEPVDLAGKRVLATTLGMSGAEVRLVLDSLYGPERDEAWHLARPGFRDCTCDELLAWHRAEIEKAVDAPARS